MNMMRSPIVCPESVRAKLTGDMHTVKASLVYASQDEKVQALSALYTTHMYVEGEFTSSKNLLGDDELLFEGRICDAKYSIKVR